MERKKNPKICLRGSYIGFFLNLLGSEISNQNQQVDRVNAMVRIAYFNRYM